MKILVLSENDIRACCDYDGLRAAMGSALSSLSLKSARNFPRHVLPLENGLLGLMGAEDAASQAAGLKAVSVFPKNVSRNLNPHQGLVILLDNKTGQVKALLEGSSLTALRTAAVSAATADVLAKKDASHMALIGAGLQALEHVRAFSKIREIREISLYSRSEERAQNLAQILAKETTAQIEIFSSPSQAVKDSDLVVTATPSREPLISTLDLHEGAHLSAVGACRPQFREVDFIHRPELKIYVDSKAACDEEAEELIYARNNKKISDSSIMGEVGECFQKIIKGREHVNDVTIFKSVGLGIEDVVAAEFFYSSAIAKNMGQEIDL